MGIGDQPALMQPTLQAVKCAVCGRLYAANAPGYILLLAKVVHPHLANPERHSGRPRPSTKELGSMERQEGTVLCWGGDCVEKALEVEQ